ncbi:hypothetical protein PVAP13_6NG147300 [Panicum virgatum]|uniref:Uncharacterized protein n=1 Tax=Panicum virgatum TaxID=38727 RepID=A0A8T0R1N0_PANVG|nr:hypothetical protein PVAP13_6NG147300 [Panicum virgatum]KAG2579070.1 hypothetical protein PVAP13_6NG147300 [Panicum virgatum]
MMQLLLRAHFSLCQSPPAGLSLPPLVRLPWLWPTLSFFLSLAAAASCRPVNGFRLYRARRAGNKGSQGGGGEINAGLGGVSSLSCTTSFRRPRRGRRSGGAVGPVLWSKECHHLMCCTQVRSRFLGGEPWWCRAAVQELGRDLPARKRKEHQCVCFPDLETAVVRAYASVLACRSHDMLFFPIPGEQIQLGIALNY